MKKLLTALAPLVIAFTTLSSTATLASDGVDDGYFVIVGSFSLYGNGGNQAQQRLSHVHGCGLSSAHIVSTDNYPNLRNGLYAVVLGDYEWSDAQSVLSQARRCIGDAYVKNGW